MKTENNNRKKRGFDETNGKNVVLTPHPYTASLEASADISASNRYTYLLFEQFCPRIFARRIFHQPCSTIFYQSELDPSELLSEGLLAELGLH